MTWKRAGECLLVAVALAATVAAAAAQRKKSDPTRLSQAAVPPTLLDQQAVAGFTIRTYSDDDSWVEVLKDGRLVFSRHEPMFRLVIGNDVGKGLEGLDAEYHPPDIRAGTDITGLGKPNVILAGSSGGAHCCFSFYVLELGDRVRQVAEIDARDADHAHFEDVDHDGIYEFVGSDFTFAYWHASFAASPAPDIILRFDRKRYVLALDLMRKPAPSAEDLSRIEAEVRASDWSDEEYLPSLLWQTMLDLIYTGHPDLAWKMVPASWAPGRMSQRRFLREFCGQLSRSPYFPALRPTLVDAPCDFKPRRR